MRNVDWLLTKIKKHKWWRQGTRDIKQLPVFAYPSLCKANNFFDLEVIIITKEGILESYKLRDKVYSFSDKFDMDFDLSYRKMSYLLDFLKKNNEKQIKNKEEALHILSQLDTLWNVDSIDYLAPQLWGFED